jgi:3-dehydroquinate synthase
MIRHGEAVAVGMMAATHLSVQAGLCSSSTAQRIRSLLTGLELPVRVRDIASAPDLSGRAGDLLAAMGTDKKRRGAVLRFVVIEDLQQITVIPNPGDELVLAAWEHILN